MTHQFDQIPHVNYNRDFVYDIETYMNCFCVCFVHVASQTRWIFEISDRRNQSALLVAFLYWLRDGNYRLFGYNNEAFDYVVIHNLIATFKIQNSFTAYDGYVEAQKIFNSKDRFPQMIWANKRLVHQCDLMKIWHHDPFGAKPTSLKKLEINMRSDNVVDLPYDPHKALTFEEMDVLIRYMCHDVSETLKFYHHSLEQIKFRDEMQLKYPDLGDVINFNEPKIGKKFFEYIIEQDAPGTCRQRVNGKRVPRQTLHPMIALGDVVSPKVHFRLPQFKAILDRINAAVIVETKGVFDDMMCTAGGIDFVFGVGGMHGSLHLTSVYPDDEYDLVDVDVASYYPSLAISNRFYPKHLSEKFCDINKQLFDQRLAVGKKTAEGAMLKLAMNGVYGDSGNAYSPFYDTKYMMSITINGQLMICMLAEWAMSTGAKMVQVNTDGITCLVPKNNRAAFDKICKEWEDHTALELEYTNYDAMHIRDVNSYIAVKPDGKGNKRIGAYCHVTPAEDPYTRECLWHKDHSMLVVPKAAEAKLVNNVDIADFIMRHKDPFDFLLSVKVPKTSRLEMWWLDGRKEPVQKTCRYYVSTKGCTLTKIMPPLARNPDRERPIGVEKGWTVKVVNDIKDFSWDDVNWLYYIEEAKKLTSWVN